MSRSPDTETVSADRLVDYRNGWSALSQLIGEGKSFSGHERNCCFLNLGPGSSLESKDNESTRFANVSATTGLDFDDDGRAVALADWDFDGAIDLWLANRSAPRVRLLRNEFQTQNHWLAVRLQGVDSNRDAIGARVEVHTNHGKRYVKTLHAGDGYLSQSSKWLHFGLATADEVQRVVVTWPQKSTSIKQRREIFRGTQIDSHWRLVQGTGNAERWLPPMKAQPLVATPINKTTRNSDIRTVILGRVPLPAIHYLDWNGTAIPLDNHLGQPLLVNLWSHTCTACDDELQAWSNDVVRITNANLKILALSVDALAANDSIEIARPKLDALSSPPLSGQASDELIEAFELTKNAFLELQSPLPVPCSFLLDRWGRVAVIYQGPIKTDQLLSDVRLLTASKNEQRSAAVPFPGKFASTVFPSTPAPVLRSLDMANDAARGIEYLRRFIKLIEQAEREPEFQQSTAEPEFHQAYKSLGDRLMTSHRVTEAIAAYSKLLRRPASDARLHREIAMTLLTNGKASSALPHFALALQGSPKDPTLLFNYGLAELSVGKVDDAISRFQMSSTQRPNDHAVHFHLGNAFQMQKKTAEAARHFRRAVLLKPDWPFAANNLAWILATSSDSSIRDGEQAVVLAEKVCQQNGGCDPSTLATLAVAYAEVGRFDVALTVNQQAITLAKKASANELVRTLEQRSQQFRGKTPYRE